MGKVSKKEWLQKSVWMALAVAAVWFSLVFCGEAREWQDAMRFMKTVYNEENGLPTGEANAVLQSGDGYIWIGSYGGLIRYDGRNFRNFSDGKDAVGSSSIRALYEDADGTLYIGTNDVGVYTYEGGEFTQIEGGDAQEFYSVRSFAADQDGVVYVGSTLGLGMVEKDQTGARSIKRIARTEEYIIYDLAADQNGTVWACSDDGKVLLVRGGELLTVADSSRWMEDDCYCVAAGQDGCIYLGGSQYEAVRLTLLDDRYGEGSFQTQSMENDLLHTFNELYEDNTGRVWAAADNGFGYFDEDGSLKVPPAMEGMLSVCSVIQDYEGNLWTASTRTGVSYFSLGKYYNYNSISKLEGASVNAILQRNGYTYVGTDHGLVVLDEELKQVQSVLTKELSGVRVRHISCTEDGTLWFCLYGTGLASYVPGDETVQFLTAKDGLLSDQVRMTLELSDHTLAVAGSGGIDILQDGKVIRSYGAEQLPYPFILCMYETEDGTLLAGSDGMGIYAIKDGEVTQYYKDEGLTSGIVMRMVPDEAQKGLWISAGNALYFWDQSGIRRSAFSNGVGSILDIRVTDENLWLMKSNGPILVEKAQLLDGEPQGRELTGAYGLTGTLVANSWNWVDEEGYLWLCTNSGISVINMQDMPINAVPPKGAVTRLAADEEQYDAPAKITIPASTRRITLDIAVMSYTPAGNYVEYCLEGFDKEKVLVSAGDASEVSYTNLNGGEYVFHVTVYNEDKVAGDSCQVMIDKEYRIWEHRWFWALLALLLVALVSIVYFIVYRIRVRSLKKRQAEYRAIVEQALHTFANAIDAKDKDTNGHSMRVARYSRELARRMKLSGEEQEKIYYMALLHDIGKIGIPDHILKKNGKLTREEWEIVKQHPVIGAEILKEFTAIPGIADGARYHHEYYNGEGYCAGLKGEEIPLLARIIAVADAFDAMCSKRYYHEKNTVEYARQELERCTGSQFDPQVAVHMIEMIDDGFLNEDA